ncbi:toxin-antitoxin system TumE family protein [Agrobacterium fabrum]
MKYSKYKCPTDKFAAIPVERSKTVLPDDAIVEIFVWKVPEPGSPHLPKYRLFGKDGRRIVGFDNERGKGDHRPLSQPITIQELVEFSGPSSG